MSHQLSPGPSHSQSVSARTKSKPPPYPMGVTAGAEDVKYQAKYKELKRKVKDIEADNDKLHFKVLNAKRNIQRMKLERAILYERLGQISPSPAPNDRHSAPAPHPGMVVHRSPPAHPAHLPGMDPDPNFIEYSRAHSRVTPGRALPAIDTSVGPNAHHNMPPMHSSRRGSASGPDGRQLPPFAQLPPMLEPAPRSPHPHHERTRSHNIPPQQAPYHLGPVQGHPDSLPPMQHVMHSPPVSDREREREPSRSRRHDLHELAGTHDPHVSISPTAEARRIHNHQRMGPGTYINDSRSRELEREREWEERELRERELNYSNTRREPSTGMHSPPAVHRPRDYPEQHHSRMREDYYDPSGPSGGAYSRVSRSGTPGSGSGSASVGANEIPSRPNSRGGYFDERSRGYRLRPVNPGHPTKESEFYEDSRSNRLRPSTKEQEFYANEEFAREDVRSQSRDRSGSGGFPVPPPHREPADPGSRMREGNKDSRKKRGEMDVDEEIEEATPGSAAGIPSYPGGVSDERDRGMQRYHRGNGDNTEDVRMGP